MTSRNVSCLHVGCGHEITLAGEDADAPMVVIQCPKCKKDNVFGRGYPPEQP